MLTYNWSKCYLYLPKLKSRVEFSANILPLCCFGSIGFGLLVIELNELLFTQYIYVCVCVCGYRPAYLLSFHLADNRVTMYYRFVLG